MSEQVRGFETCLKDPRSPCFETVFLIDFKTSASRAERATATSRRPTFAAALEWFMARYVVNGGAASPVDATLPEAWPCILRPHSLPFWHGDQLRN